MRRYSDTSTDTSIRIVRSDTAILILTRDGLSAIGDIHLFSELSSRYIEIPNYSRWQWKLYDDDIKDIFSDTIIASAQNQ